MLTLQFGILQGYLRDIFAQKSWITVNSLFIFNTQLFIQKVLTKIVFVYFMFFI